MSASAAWPNVGFGWTHLTERGQGADRRIPAERTEGHDDPQLAQEPDLAREERGTRVSLLDGRPVGRGRAADGGCDVGIEQGQAIVGGARRRTVGQPDRMECRPQEVARRVAGEDPAGPVGTVRRGGKTDEQDPPIRVAEAGNGPTPVPLTLEAPDLVPGDLTSPGHESWASRAADDLRRQRRECRRIRHRCPLRVATGAPTGAAAGRVAST